MELFYTNNVEGNKLFLSGDDHIHCTKSLRHGPGDQISITDGQGNLYGAVIESVARNESVCNIISKMHTPHHFPALGIAITPTKNVARIEWFVEKAIEVGISEILLFRSSRTERKHINPERINKIAISAMKQSQQLWLPQISVFDDYSQMIRYATKYQDKFIAHCSGPTASLSELTIGSQSSLVLIGPEGDFTNDEINLALQSGYTSVSLGDTRLRTETAGLVALILLRFRC